MEMMHHMPSSRYNKDPVEEIFLYNCIEDHDLLFSGYNVIIIFGQLQEYNWRDSLPASNYEFVGNDPIKFCQQGTVKVGYVLFQSI